MKLKLKFAIV